MKISIRNALILLFALYLPMAFANRDKWYHVEVMIFETKDKEAVLEQLSSDPGKPSIHNVVNINEDPTTEFGQLPENQYVLTKAKERIQKSYPLVLHKGWRQKIEDKAHAQKVHLMGGRDDATVDGTVTLSLGRTMHVNTDFLVRPIGSIESQPVRLKGSSRIRLEEMQYIDHPHYGMIIMVTPEKA